MGRNTTTPSPASLDRYSIGEIVDISGVSTYYDAGTSKWLKSGSFTEGSNLSASVKATLAASATSVSTATIALATANDMGLAASYPVAREQFMEVRIASINTTVILRATTNSVNIMTINSTGAINLSPLTGSYLTGDLGSQVGLTTNGTKFFIYYYTSASALACKTSTDGITWTTESLSGLPTITLSTLYSAFWDYTTSNTQSANQGYYYGGNIGSYGGNSLAIWCGARFLFMSRETNGYITASLSSNGLAFTDSTNAVIGSTTLSSAGNQMNFYRNGNNCFLALGTTFRKSTDGGATWSAATFAAAINAGQHYNIPNITDPTKRIIVGSDGNSDAYYTSDSGGTWSANRALPQATRWGIAYKGSTVTSCYNDGCWRSVDDGVTWTSIVFPAGTNSSSGQIVADENRFYFVPYGGGSQLLISTDAITWTISATPGTVTGTGGITANQVSSSVVYLTNNLSQGFFTLDGGVTWSFAATSSSSYGQSTNAYFIKRTTDGPTGGYLIFGKGNKQDASYNYFLSSASVIAGGGFYRTGSTAISPVRANAFSYVRVG